MKNEAKWTAENGDNTHKGQTTWDETRQEREAKRAHDVVKSAVDRTALALTLFISSRGATEMSKIRMSRDTARIMEQVKWRAANSNTPKLFYLWELFKNVVL